MVFGSQPHPLNATLSMHLKRLPDVSGEHWSNGWKVWKVRCCLPSDERCASAWRGAHLSPAEHCSRHLHRRRQRYLLHRLQLCSHRVLGRLLFRCRLASLPLPSSLLPLVSHGLLSLSKTDTTGLQCETALQAHERCSEGSQRGSFPVDYHFEFPGSSSTMTAMNTTALRQAMTHRWARQRFVAPLF